MPASEETYRSQPTLHIAFALSSIAMLLSIVWMIMADHLRPWKEVQRTFQMVEQAKLKGVEKQKLKEQNDKYKTEIDTLKQQIAEAERNAKYRSSELRKVDSEIKKLGGDFEGLDTKKRFKKAELDSKRSEYDLLIDRDLERAARLFVISTIKPLEDEYEALSKKYEVAEKELNIKKAQREELLGNVDEKKKELEKLTREADRVARTIVQKDALYGGSLHWYSKPMAFIRGLPGIDLMPPTKIQQITLPDLTINYNFKDVPRFDRCTTCHLGIDRLGYDTDPDGKPMKNTHPAFAAHPHLTDGATTIDPKGKVVPAGLYLDANGPHPINSFGCTICHGGQGSGTDFTYSSHEPNDLEERERWEHQYHWREMHHWDEPMLPSRFMESSCVKCHHLVTDIPQAKKLQAGYERITKFGCTGCHTIGGEGSFGPDLTDEPQTGPNLAHVASKVSRDWLLKWIKNPHAFRPDSRMPRFYGVTNNDSPKDWPKNHAEIHAITAYLFAKSTPPALFGDAPAKTDPKHGRELFLQKGCLACHSHRPYAASEVQPQDQNEINPKYQPDPALTYDPSQFPESVRQYAQASFGPNLSNIAAKFARHDEGTRWLANWIKSPEAYHPKSLMPNLQLAAQDAADIAAWIMSVPGEWPVKVEVPDIDAKEVKQAVDELVEHYVVKGGYTRDGKTRAVPLSEVPQFVKDNLSYNDKLMFLGEKTISRLGCFGCHNIPGFENAKPIGTPLDGWGSKNPAKLDFGHIAEYIADQPLQDDGARDGTDPYYQEKLADHSRMGFLYQKVHRPRSYDYKKTSEDLKAWDDRLRMPQFSFANDPKAVEEVMTFILGMTGEKIEPRYLPKTKYKPAQFALAHGEKLLNRHNCTGCHVLRMPTYTIAGGKVDEALPNLAANVSASYNGRAEDYLVEYYPSLTYDPKKKPELKPDDGKPVAIEGMPVSLIEDDLTIQLWRPVTIRGFTFNVGNNLTLNQKAVRQTAAETDKAIEKTESDGGNFAWLYATSESERTGSNFADYWNSLPPPLLREGLKVQTPWVTAFLHDPYPIRPAALLRMPRFHFGRSNRETSPEANQEMTGLANYFAARDGAEFPYQEFPERTRAYLAREEARHPDYLAAGWEIMTKGACVQCHAIGQYKPTGSDKSKNGPDLRQVSARFRPEYLEEWIANPKRLLPYTAMPQNLPPSGDLAMPVPKTFEKKRLDMVEAASDTLLNYIDVIEHQLAGAKPAVEKPATAPKPSGASE